MSVRQGVLGTARDTGILGQVLNFVDFGIKMDDLGLNGWINGVREANSPGPVLSSGNFCATVAFYPVGAASRVVHVDYYAGRQRRLTA